MKSILKTLGDELKEDDLLEKANEIEAFYKEGNIHLYSETFLIVNDSENDEIDYIIKNLQSIFSILDRKESKVSSRIEKLIDFIQMEQMREVHIEEDHEKKLMDLIQTVANKQLEAVNEVQKETMENKQYVEEKLEAIRNSYHELTVLQKQANEEFEKQAREIEKFNGNLVSVLGIFGAIIVAFFGGLSFLGGVLDNMHNVSAYRLIFIGALYLVGLFNIIFLLFYCISKLVHKPLWTSNAHKGKCSQCQHTNRIKCFTKKYPLVAYFNSGMIIILVNIIFLYMMDKLNIFAQLVENFNFNSNKGLNIAICAIVVYLIITAFVIGIVLLMKKSKTVATYLKCPCNCTQSNTQIPRSSGNVSSETTQMAAVTLQENNEE